MKQAYIAGALVALITSTPSLAASTLKIENSADIKWGITGGKVYFRNLNEFDPSWLGCCFSYYVDLATDEGKAMFSVFLAKTMSDEPLMLYMNDPTQAGPIKMMGNW